MFIYIIAVIRQFSKCLFLLLLLNILSIKMIPFPHGIMAFATVPYYRNLLFVPQTIGVISQTADESNSLLSTIRSTPLHFPQQPYPFTDYFKEPTTFNDDAATSIKFQTMPRWLMSPELGYPGSYTPTRKLQEYQPSEYKRSQPFQPEYKTDAKSNNTKASKPTIYPLSSEIFNPLQDAKALFRALKGSKIDGSKIIEILTKRSNEQRMQIASRYRHFYDADLQTVIRSKTKGKFREVLLALLTPLTQYYASELNRAMSSSDTNEDVLIEILCTLSNDEIQMVKQMYYQTYNVHLEEDISLATSGNFQKLLLTLCAVNRSEDYRVNVKKAIHQAKRLIEAGQMRMETEELAFISILCSQSFPQLTEIFSQYYTMTGQNIEEAITNEFVGVIKKALKAIARSVHSKPAFFAERLYKSMSGLGTNNRQLIRTMITRSEIDLGDIEEVFYEQYHYSLETWIEEDCHGNFKKCLLAILGAL